MTSRKVIHCSSLGKGIRQAFQAHYRYSAAFHTTIRTSKKKDDKTLKDIKTYDFMSNMNEFDSKEVFYSPEKTGRWKYEGFVILVSYFCFCLYFFVLREKNQLDEHLNTPLFTTVPKIELIELSSRITQLKKDGKDFSKELARFEEVKKIIEKKEGME